MSSPSQNPVDLKALPAFLAPLAKFTARHGELDALVFWANPDWDDEPTEDLDAEEAPFYLEGLAPEGFRLEWRILALVGEKAADHIRLYIYEEGAPPPACGPEWLVLSSGQWPVVAA